VFSNCNAFDDIAAEKIFIAEIPLYLLTATLQYYHIEQPFSSLPHHQPTVPV